ncbi:HIT family protein [Macrococcus carouselicus]|uniref:HIT family protein n=1 Tax=Macrococcus carouselicus TaxID=69969 RepID=A0A9Q8CNZ6_9STAP|nr:HIT family protein [Macrococcus carouselicus]TDM04152.1 HIT family protein [Macrococcus carouselicus]
MKSESCHFCHQLAADQVLYETLHFKVVMDIDPIQEGHLLLIVKRHVMNYLHLKEEELTDLMNLQRQIIGIFENELDTGVTLVMNNGRMMDQQTHFHVHLIPRYQHDGFWDDTAVRERPLNIDRLIHLLKET